MQINVLEYLENTIVKCPDKLAYSDGSAGLTFRQVSDCARAVGSFLGGLGCRREPVAVCMRKSPETVAAFFGVVYSGCYYVPLDDEMPRHRVEMILEKLRPSAVICDSFMRGYMDEMNCQYPLHDYSDIAKTPVDEQLLCAIRSRAIDTDPIYTVFTSGSTGTPKGVVACHRSVLDYIEALSEVLGFGEDTVFGNQAPLYVDACLKELYPTIKFGASTFLIPKNLFMFPVKLLDYLNENHVNTVCWVVSALTMISGLGALEINPPKHLRTIAFGGEVFPMAQLNKWRSFLPDARFVNLYGPTEATGMSCYFEVDRSFGDDETLPVGKPFRNTEILLLGDDGREAEYGGSGEICIRGTSLTMGYWGDFGKTGEAFTQNPLNCAYPDLIYRTGDIGKYNERGELMFISRRDHQIKHMGHRIELGEIEAVAARLEGIRRTCCVFDDKNKKITLFYEGEAAESDMAAHLLATLPRYMAPHSFVPIEKMPLTANGKLDRNALLK